MSQLSPANNNSRCMHCEDDDDHDDVMRVITMIRVNCKASLRTEIYTTRTGLFQQKIEFVRNASLCTCDTLQYQLLQQWIRTSKSAWKSYTYNILYYNIEPSKKADQWIISPGLLGRWSARIQASDVLNQASRLWALFIDWTKITGCLPFQLPHWPSPESESGWVSITW